jgi:hypothetical protein
MVRSDNSRSIAELDLVMSFPSKAKDQIIQKNQGHIDIQIQLFPIYNCKHVNHRARY